MEINIKQYSIHQLEAPILLTESESSQQLESTGQITSTGDDNVEISDQAFKALENEQINGVGGGGGNGGTGNGNGDRPTRPD